ELRTPLTVIKGYLSMLCDSSLGQAPAELHQPMELLAAKAEELSGLVDDLLFTSRLEAGRLATHPMRLNLRLPARGAARRTAPRVHLLGGELVIELPEEPLIVRADPDPPAPAIPNPVHTPLT